MCIGGSKQEIQFRAKHDVVGAKVFDNCDLSNPQSRKIINASVSEVL
jgi:hypothetical protein